MTQMLLRRIWLFGALWIGCWGFPLSGFATEVAVELTGTGRHYIQIVVPPFEAQGIASYDIERELAPVLRHDLRLSGFFDTLVQEQARIERLHKADLNTGAIQFKEWDALGARLLVKGVYVVEGETLKIECRLYDTLGGDVLFGKRYESNLTHARKVMHRFADEIIFKMTGERGSFSSKIVFTSNRSGATELYQIDFDGKNLLQLTNDNSLILTPAVSPDGSKVCFTSYKDNNPDLYIISLDDRKIERIAMFPGLNFSTDWAPDNHTLALTLSKDGNPELYLLDVNTGQASRLTRNHWNDLSPSWSPDGKELVYTADKIGAPQLYILNRHGENIRRLTFRGSYNVSPTWSPTGEQIAFSSSMDGQFNIYTVDVNGDNLRQLTMNAGNNEDPAWSPDGRYIAFQSTRDGGSSIYIMNADGTNQRQLTDTNGADFSPVWMK